MDSLPMVVASLLRLGATPGEGTDRPNEERVRPVATLSGRPRLTALPYPLMIFKKSWSRPLP